MNAYDPTAPALSDAKAVDAVAAGGWPRDLPDSTYALLERTARERSAATALSFFLETRHHKRPFRWSYKAYLDEVTRAANVFHRLGVQRGEAVALVLPNLPETYFTLWGAETAGIAMPINPLLEAEGLSDLIRASGAGVVVTLAPFPGQDLYGKVVEAIAEIPGVRALVTVELAPYVRGLKRWPAKLAQSRAARAAPKTGPRVRLVSYAAARKEAPGDRLESGQRPRASDMASLFGTGGSTGSPKLARRTQANELANAFMSTRMLGDVLKPDGMIFAGLPLFHVNGAMVTGLAPILTGGQVLLGTPQGYRGAGLIPAFWDIVDHHRVRLFTGVPTLFSSLLQHPPKGHDLSCLDYAICGAAPMSPELIARFEKTTDLKILEGYGLTEATCVAALNPANGRQRAGSVGLALPFQDVKIVQVDERGAWIGEAETGETGIVALAGPNVFHGYVLAKHNAGLWLTDEAGRSWLNTGDLGALDADGYLWLRGRAKDIIIRGGHNIDPALIEDAFYAHPAVALAAAIGRPDAHAGEVPVVFVELKPGASATPRALLAFACEKIPERAAHPKAVYILEALPLTAVGKVFKPALREIEAGRAKSREPASA